MARTLVIRRRRLGYAAVPVTVAVAVAVLAGCGQQPAAPPLVADLGTPTPSSAASPEQPRPATSPLPTTPATTPGAETITVAAVAPTTSRVTTQARSTTAKSPPKATPTTTKPTPKPTPKPSPPPAPAPVPVTTPVSDPSWQACTAQLGGVSVAVGARQRTVTVVNGSGGSTAVVSFWLRTNTPCGFANAFTDPGGRTGYGGMTNGATRTQGNGTTPTGTYTMTEAFGIQPTPGTALPYRRVGVGDFWVEDNNSAFYNTYRNESQGGFDATLPLSDPNGSERLLSFPGQYDYVIVVNFNRAPDTQKPYRGAGIFIHVRGSGATAGCIAVSSSEMVTMLQAMRPGDTVTIAS